MPAKKSENPTKEDLLKIVLDQSAAMGWQFVTMRDIAQEAGISLSEVHAHFHDRMGILCALGDMVDQKMLAQASMNINPETAARDRLFEVMMDRFDILNEHRAGFLSILKSFKGEPNVALASLPKLGQSMAWVLEVASASLFSMI